MEKNSFFLILEPKEPIKSQQRINNPHFREIKSYSKKKKAKDILTPGIGFSILEWLSTLSMKIQGEKKKHALKPWVKG